MNISRKLRVCFAGRHLYSTKRTISRSMLAYTPKAKIAYVAATVSVIVVLVLLIVQIASLLIAVKPQSAIATNEVHEKPKAEALRTPPPGETAKLTLSQFQRLLQMETSVRPKELPYEERLRKAIPCHDKILQLRVQQHGKFWALLNFVRAEKQFRCYESITLTTQADYTFLDNVIPLVKRWQGPISVALHAPGTDFEPTIDSIAFLRNCVGPLVRNYVTFHIIFDMGHNPTKPSGRPFDLPLIQLYNDKYNCSRGAPYAPAAHKKLYKISANITYPINVARNVARENAQTHFVLASDIELYPSRNVINGFLHMIANKPYLFENDNPMVFVLPVFEVLGNETAPEDKKTLQGMIRTNRSFSFHMRICHRCHVIPHLDEWLAMEVSDEIDIFTKAKRTSKFERWEAVYIGTNDDPFFDEHLDWEHHGNKMVQAYMLCVLNYDYMVLDNVFLVHKPGIKQKMVNAEIIPQTALYIRKQLSIEIDSIYHKRKGCKP